MALTPPARAWVLDGIKGLAALVILLHHAASYGPLAQAWEAATPRLSEALYDYGRMTVQVFLVAAGFLAAQSLAQPNTPLSPQSVAQLAWRRYLRLVWPLGVALLLASAMAAWSRPHLPGEDWLSEPADIGIWLSHLTLMHSVLDHEAMSAGVWYIAIDFQLFVLMLLLHMAPRVRWTQVALVALMLASLWVFNRWPHWDDGALYFFGAYGLGACAAYARTSPRAQIWRLGMALAIAVSLLIEARWRVALAGATAGLLSVVPLQPPAPAWLTGASRWAGQRSFGLFLVHFPLLMGFSALWERLDLPAHHVGWALLALVLLSGLLADALWRWVERPGPPMITPRLKPPTA
jgi:peptidoglycan/LPS O-acetylase OafA/YrhL